MAGDRTGITGPLQPAPCISNARRAKPPGGCRDGGPDCRCGAMARAAAAPRVSSASPFIVPTLRPSADGPLARAAQREGEPAGDDVQRAGTVGRARRRAGVTVLGISPSVLWRLLKLRTILADAEARRCSRRAGTWADCTSAATRASRPSGVCCGWRASTSSCIPFGEYRLGRESRTAIRRAVLVQVGARPAPRPFSSVRIFRAGDSRMSPTPSDMSSSRARQER